MNTWTRRDFTKTVIIAGATTALGAMRAAGANERVPIGFIVFTGGRKPRNKIGLRSVEPDT